jgi:hypothetical protein
VPHHSHRQQAAAQGLTAAALQLTLLGLQQLLHHLIHLSSCHLTVIHLSTAWQTASGFELTQHPQHAAELLIRQRLRQLLLCLMLQPPQE